MLNGIINFIIQTNPCYEIDDCVNLSGATVRIDYAGSNGEITKPLIVAEGFDTGHITAPETFGGDRSIDSFKTNLFNSGSSDLRDLLFWDNSQEYDIIYIDWKDGTDKIQKNSVILEGVINWVNENKTTTTQNVLLGQSMGGLVGRYTLARMEKEGDENHDVQLFIAHDSPMQGANTPLSVQYFSRHFHNEYVSVPIAYYLGDYALPFAFGLAELISDAINSLGGNTSVENYIAPGDVLTLQDTPAAVQMNYEWVTFNEEATTILHDDWQEDFEEMGYPENSRNIAVSNGNQCGLGNDFEPGDPYVLINDYDNPDFWGDLVHMIATPLIGITTGDIGMIGLGFLPGSSKYHYKFDINSTTNNQNKVYYGRIYYKKKIFGIGPEITHVVTDRDKYAESFSLSYGAYAGGLYDINNVSGNLPDFLPPQNLVNPKYGFIPVVSALDIRKNSSIELQDVDYKKAYGAYPVPYSNMNTSFDNFIVDYHNGPINSDHISFQSENGNWLAAELDVDPSNPEYPEFDCTMACSDINIFGPESFCDNSTFSVPSGADDYEWSILGGGIVSMSEGNSPNSVTLSQINNESGYVWLYVNIVNDKCDDVSIQKKVHVGSPTVENIQQISDQAAVPHFSPATGLSTCDEIGIELNFAPSNADVQEIEWEKITSDVMWSRDYASYNDRYAYIYPDCNETFEFRVRAKSNCGWSDWQDLSYEITSCDNNCPTGGGSSSGNISSDDYLIYPVPADTQLSIKMEEFGNNITLLTTPLNVKLYSSSGSGLIVFDQDFTVSLADVDVSGLSPGTYLLVLTYEGELESHNVIIE